MDNFTRVETFEINEIIRNSLFIEVNRLKQHKEFTLGRISRGCSFDVACECVLRARMIDREIDLIQRYLGLV